MLTYGRFSRNWVVADVSFYYSFVQLICLFVALCFSKQKSFRPTRDGSKLVQGFLLYVFSSLMKGRLVVLFCAFSGKMVIQKTKKIFFSFNHFHISA